MSTCPHNMVNFGRLAAEIGLVVLGTPANFNGFGVLAALLHGTVVVGVSQTAALNIGRHLYSAGRPSRVGIVPHSSYRIFFVYIMPKKCPHFIEFGYVVCVVGHLL